MSPDQIIKSTDDLMKIRKNLKSHKDCLSGLKKTNNIIKEKEQ